MIRIVGRQSRSEKLEQSCSVGEVMERLGISDERFVYLLNGTPVTRDVIVSPDQDLLFLEIFSGG
ncbi:MoaD/ThiS family protein [Cuniculiplasma divulgatum]|jgi:sulfur carrier protein ThiS|uniref:Sulfur transfer protein involved in thiamine biosynthesis n=1 Tax=Cuniculiplasma divulgatum TaxID=1673428 RepID=A0A1N5SNQ3_9ARCH|nr:MoaD/ThiS family protein [Cuniculiplasma divulgatum]MCL4320720.1 hypothetical protein [Candidatus Thermoplasmatota archaeon]OWP54951.1 MAG: hypothetical protein B2I18_07045 [Cuniculiplasma sp. C_DKE]WMT48503.1 MAG: hypothetical protein RE472_05350 [Thermoplasmatales archaeon]MCL6014027.1 hypothetical protein [Candidatus Thermoplasmatota archaeon]SIM37734.1 sulfur transfer protein involved in thiamine biosynthesis [Cuniculiplasma divulgatum]